MFNKFFKVLLFVLILGVCGCSSNKQGSGEGSQDKKEDLKKEPIEILSTAIEKYSEYQNFTIEKTGPYGASTIRFVNKDKTLYALEEVTRDGEQEVSISKYTDSYIDQIMVEYVDENKKQVRYENWVPSAYAFTKWRNNYMSNLVNELFVGMEYKEGFEFFTLSTSEDDEHVITAKCNDINGLSQAVTANVQSYLPESEDKSKYVIQFSKSEATFVLNKEGDIIEANLDVAYENNGHQIAGAYFHKILNINTTKAFNVTIVDSINNEEHPGELVYDLE